MAPEIQENGRQLEGSHPHDLGGKNYTPNTLGSSIKVLKKFMHKASERGFAVREDYRKKGFANPSEETVAVYLTETELMQMYGSTFRTI